MQILNYVNIDSIDKGVINMSNTRHVNIPTKKVSNSKKDSETRSIGHPKPPRSAANPPKPK